MFKKLVSALVIFTFVVSNLAFAIPDQTAQNKTEIQKQENIDIVANPEKMVILRDYGLVKSKYVGKSGRLIVHIQDAHCNFEAQSNIVKVLEGLYKNYNVNFISVEGADGVIDTTWFKSFPDEDIRKEVASYFMKKGEITGPEYLAITSDYPIKLFGAETRSYYIENLNAFTSSYPQKEEIEKYLNQIKSVIERLKNYIYSEDLKLMDVKVKDYESKKTEFKDYVKFLETMSGKLKINLRQYDNLFKLVSTLIFEKKIDFNVTDKERNALIDDLSKKVSKDALAELVSQSLSFKSGKISSAEYYAYLKQLAGQNGVDLAGDFPNLFNYIIYNSVYSRIENEKLFSDIKNIENAIKEKLFQNDDQRTLEKLSRHIDTLLGLVNIKLLNGDFDYYKEHKDEFSYEVFVDFLSRQSAKFGLSYVIDPPSEVVAESIPKLEDFYAIAIKRDKALVDNTLNEMKKEKQKIGVLVTGGFHSEGITKLLEQAGVSYIVVCPNITKDVETPYIKILTNQRTPLEDILLENAPTQTKQNMLAPILISRLVGLSPERIKTILSEVEGVDRARLEALIKGIIGREQQLERGWETIGVTKWLMRALKVAGINKYAQDEAIMFDAYKYAMEAALIKAGKPQSLAREITAAITGSAEFKSAFHVLYTRISGRDSLNVDRTSPGTGNLIGKYQDEDGCVVTDFRGILSEDKSSLDIVSARDGASIITIEVLGNEKVDVSRQVGLIEKKIKDAIANGSLNSHEITVASGTLEFLRKKSESGSVYLLNENKKGILGYADGDNIFISKYLVNNPIALFHEAGEGYFSSSPETSDTLLEKGATPHSYLRGMGYKARAGAVEVRDAELGLRGGLGLQDRIFGKAANMMLSNIIIANKILFQKEKASSDYLESIKRFSTIDKRDIVLRVGEFNAEEADKLAENIGMTSSSIYTEAIDTILKKTKDWSADNLILLGQIVRMLGHLNLTAEEAKAVIKQLEDLYFDRDSKTGPRGRRSFDFIKTAPTVKPEEMENIEAQQELDTFIVQTIESIGIKHKDEKDVTGSVAKLLINIAKDDRKLPGLYFVREQAIFSMKSFWGINDVQNFINSIINNEKKSAQFPGWPGYVPEEQNFGTSPSYSNVADLRYSAGMANLGAVADEFRLGLQSGNFTSGKAIADYWNNLQSWKSAVLMEIENQLNIIYQGEDVEADKLTSAARKALIDSLPNIGAPAVGMLDLLRKIYEEDNRGLGTKAGESIIKLCEKVYSMKPAKNTWAEEYRMKLDKAAANLNDEAALNDLVKATKRIFEEVQVKTEIAEPGSPVSSLSMPKEIDFNLQRKGALLTTLSGGGGATFAINVLRSVNYFDLGESVYPTCPMGVDDDGGSTKYQKAAAISGPMQLPLMAFGDMTKAIDLPKPVKDFIGIRIQGNFHEYVNGNGSYKLLKKFVEENKYLNTLRDELTEENKYDSVAIEKLITEIEAAIDTYDALFIDTKSTSLYKNTVQNMVMMGFLIKEGGFCIDQDDPERPFWFINPNGINQAFVKYIAVMNFKDVKDVTGHPLPVTATPNILVASLPNGLRKIGQDYFSHTRIRDSFKISGVEGYFPQLPTNPLSEQVIRESSITMIPPTSFYTSMRPVLNNAGIARILKDRADGDEKYISFWVLPPATDMEETRGMTVEDLLDGYIDKVGRLPNVVFYLDSSNPTEKTKVLLDNLRGGIYSGSLALTRDRVKAIRSHLLDNKGVTLKTLEELIAERRYERKLTQDEIEKTVIFVPIDANKILFEKAEASRISGKDEIYVRYNEEEVGNAVRDAIEYWIQKILGRNIIDNRAEAIAKALTTPLNAKGVAGMAARFKEDKEDNPGYGVAEWAAVNGSYAVDGEGDQGYYVSGGKKLFTDTVNKMKALFDKRKNEDRPIKYVIKPGIGGQHTPFQAIAAGFKSVGADNTVFVGEYELGKNYEVSMADTLKGLGIEGGWDQIAVIPSSKSGSTDETMMIFTDILYVLLKNVAAMKMQGLSAADSENFANAVLGTMHDANFSDGEELPAEKLFANFKLTNVEDTLKGTYHINNITSDKIKEIVGTVLGNMFFETSSDENNSRLAAFVKHSDLSKELGANAPGFGAMFDNVGGRWTGDLHMMTFLAYYGLDAEKYWEARYKGIKEVKNGTHTGNKLGNMILDKGITDIAFVMPDQLFWLGKAIEQNFNESIWQNGFANLIAVKQSMWKYQSSHYEDVPGRLVINISELDIPGAENLGAINLSEYENRPREELAEKYAELFTTFYGMTSTVGDRLIARAVTAAGYSASDVDMNNLDNNATKIVQSNLYLRQPYVELGKKLLDDRLKDLQAKESKAPGAIDRELKNIKDSAKDRRTESNVSIDGWTVPYRIRDAADLADVIARVAKLAKDQDRKFVPFIYLEGDKYAGLREHLVMLGVEWVLQGTGDQHINYQQVLANPKRYLPFFVSYVPQDEIKSHPAVGFAKGTLNNVSPNMARDFFAYASYKALTEKRAKEGGLGVFLRLSDDKEGINILRIASEKALGSRTGKSQSAPVLKADTAAKPAAKVQVQAPVKPVVYSAGREKASGEKSYPAGDSGELTAEQVYQVSTLPERDSLQQYLASSALSDALDNRVVIIAADTAIAPGQVAQAGERSINRYLNGKLINVRATGAKLLDGIREAVGDLEAKGIPYSVVTIAGNGTLQETGDGLSKVGKVLNVQNPDNRYMPVIGLYELALRIAYGNDSDDILSCLNRVALNSSSQPFTKDDVEGLLTKGILLILPKIVPVNPSEAAEAYKAAQQALASL